MRQGTTAEGDSGPSSVAGPTGTAEVAVPSGRARRVSEAVRDTLFGEAAPIVGLAVMVIGLIVLFSAKSPDFLTLRNFANLGVASAIVGIVAPVETMVLISRGLDLSINGVLGLSGIVSALVVVNTGSVALAVAAGLGTGAGVGVIHALLIVKVRINAFIATIGTLFVFSGVAYLITDGQAVTTTNVPGFGDIGNGTVIWGSPLLL